VFGVTHIAWAGSETAVVHTGYMEDAIESGERAAAQVLASVAVSSSLTA
jgi:monoamine oxidase